MWTWKGKGYLVEALGFFKPLTFNKGMFRMTVLLVSGGVLWCNVVHVCSPEFTFKIVKI